MDVSALGNVPYLDLTLVHWEVCIHCTCLHRAHILRMFSKSRRSLLISGVCFAVHKVRTCEHIHSSNKVKRVMPLLRSTLGVYVAGILVCIRAWAESLNSHPVLRTVNEGH